MKVRMLDVVQRCKKEIEDKTLETHRTPRVDQVGAVPYEPQQTPDPHDIHSLIQNIWQFPGVRKVITDGIDEDFNTERVTP